jgi:PEP-CTERM motif
MMQPSGWRHLHSKNVRSISAVFPASSKTSQSFKTVPVPEPSTLLLFGSALALVQAVKHRRSIFSF